MNINFQFFKILTLNIFILINLFSFGMEQKKEITFKGFINLSDARSSITFGHILNPGLSIELEPKTAKLEEYLIKSDSKTKTNYENFQIYDHNLSIAYKLPISGKYEKFILVKLPGGLTNVEEIPVI